MSANVRDIYAVSPMQRLFWVAVANDPRLGVVQFRYRLTGALDADRFERAWRLMVERHEPLRTAILSEHVDDPVHVVFDAVETVFVQYDWSCLEGAAQQSRVEAFLDQDRQRGLTIDRPPLTRFALLRGSENTWEFVWTFYRGLLDGWSVDLLWNEVWQAYTSPAAVDALPAPVSFKSYIAWLQNRPSGGCERFWRSVLENASRDHDSGLFAHAFRSATDSSSAEERVVLPASMTRVLREAALDHGVTVNALVVAGWALANAALAGRDDVVVGATVSGRPLDLPGADAIVGMFINNLPVRLQVRDGESLTDVCQRLQAQQVDAREFDHASIEDIHRWSGLPASKRLFDTLLVFQGLDSAVSAHVVPSNLTVTDLNTPLPTSLPLTVICVPGNSLTFLLEYDRTRCDERTVASLVANLKYALRAIVETPDAAAHDILARMPARRTALPPIEPAGAELRPADEPVVSPANDIEARLVQIWKELLGLRAVSVHDDFFASGGSSLLALRLFETIQQAFGVRLPLGSLFKSATIRNLGNQIALTTAGATSASCLVEIRSGRTKPPLFLTHGIGSEVISYGPLAAQFAQEQPVFGIQGWGRDLEAVGTPTIEARAEAYIAALKKLAPAGPYFLAGHCAGAIMTFELARQLEARGDEVGLVGIIDYWLADAAPEAQSSWQVALDAGRNLPLWISDDLMPSGVREIAGRIQSKTRAVVSRAAQQFIAAPASTDIRDLLGMWHYPDAAVPLLEADFKMFSEYRPQAYAGRVTVFRPRTLPLLERRPLDDLGWSAVADGGVDVHVVAGSHSTIMKEPLVRHLADAIQRAIDQYTAAHPHRRQKSAAS